MITTTNILTHTFNKITREISQPQTIQLDTLKTDNMKTIKINPNKIIRMCLQREVKAYLPSTTKISFQLIQKTTSLNTI
jgi:hypothetical protein